MGPRGGANVGAVCRAVKNTGAGALVTVDGAFDEEEARRMAVHAADVLEARTEVGSLREAVAGSAVVVGTTARTGPLRERSADIRTVARELVRWERERSDAGREFAFVFGPEDRGLSNEEIAVCHRLAFIPTSPDYHSLNLAQAVLLCCYEVMRARHGLAAPSSEVARDAHEAAAAAPARRPPADAGEIEDMFVDLEGALVEIGFLFEDHPERVMASLRSLLSRAGLDERELKILRGLARQIRWFARDGREVAADKRARGVKLR